MFIPEALKSDVFNAKNPPKDFADVAFLVPHEGLRRMVSAFSNSVSALKEDYPDEEHWKVLYFSEWYLDYFFPIVVDHHKNEEAIYFPAIKTKGVDVPERLTQTHDDLVDLLKKTQKSCEAVVAKNGIKCSEEIKQLKSSVEFLTTDLIGKYEKMFVIICVLNLTVSKIGRHFFFTEHLNEEETIFPPLVREKFTEAEHQKVIDSIVQKEGLTGTRLFLPVILEALKEWATPEFVNGFVGSMPPPIRSLFFNYYVPDYETHASQLRDAPLADKKPSLSKVPCCKIPFCIPCIC